MTILLRLAKQMAALSGLVLAAVTLSATRAEAGPALATDVEHKGIVTAGPYQIFPENRTGNGVYFNNQLMASSPEKTIIQIVPLAKDGRFVYLMRNADEKSELQVRLARTDSPPRVERLADGIYFATMIIDEVVYKKVYRVVQNSIIADVLPRSKTADGMAPGKSGLVFYHVSGAETIEQDGKTIYQFKLRLHLLMYQEERLRNLDYPVINTLPRLQLAWKDDSSVEYTLADGRVEALSTAQFQ